MPKPIPSCNLVPKDCGRHWGKTPGPCCKCAYEAERLRNYETAKNKAFVAWQRRRKEHSCTTTPNSSSLT